MPAGPPFEAPLAEYWVAHGYVVVYVDPRGTWGPEGDQAHSTPQQAREGYDVVEWAGTQAWSNGHVGLSGVPYLAISQYAIAAKASRMVVKRAWNKTRQIHNDEPAEPPRAARRSATATTRIPHAPRAADHRRAAET